MYNASDFEVVGIDEAQLEVKGRPPVNYWKDAWRRYKENKAAFVALGILIILVVMIIVGPNMNEFPHDHMNPQGRYETPNAVHWFGTDAMGRDTFTRLWLGGRVSIIIGLFGAFVTSIAGTIYGGVSGFLGGAADTVMMRIVEVLTSIPYLLVVILISVITDSKSMGTMLLALTITGWCGIARMVRGQVLQLKSQDFVMAAKALGVSSFRIIIRHMVPNTIGVIMVAITFNIPGYIFSEAFLSFLGLGIQPPNTSWGAMAADAQQIFTFYPLQLLFPALMIALTMLSFTMIGDGLRDAFDPRLRK